MQCIMMHNTYVIYVYVYIGTLRGTLKGTLMDPYRNPLRLFTYTYIHICININPHMYIYIYIYIYVDMQMHIQICASLPMCSTYWHHTRTPASFANSRRTLSTRASCQVSSGLVMSSDRISTWPVFVCCVFGRRKRPCRHTENATATAVPKSTG